MAKILDVTVTADGNTDITWKTHRRETPLRGTVYVYGTFGGGTVTLQSSPDSSTTFINVLDSTGAATTFTANKTQNFELYSDAEAPVKLRLALAGSTTPSLNYTIFDDI